MSDTIRRDQRHSPVNVAQVRQLSPFRYPGGKTWLVPVARDWLESLTHRPQMLLEPFAGGAMIGLTAAAEGLAARVHLVELDDDVAAVWSCTFNAPDADFDKLLSRIHRFEVSEENVRATINGSPRSIHGLAFRTVVKNRCQRGGIMAPGAGLVKTGEGGRGLSSRWYPDTLIKRFRALRGLSHIISFEQGDALEAIIDHPDAALFVDPPYTAAGKKAGSRLYAHNEVDHDKLLDLVAASDQPTMTTYDDTAEIRSMAAERGLRINDVPMKNSHHVVMKELVLVGG